MKCLIDAQLPKDLARLLETWGIDAIHTSDLPAGNRTTDKKSVPFLLRSKESS